MAQFSIFYLAQYRKRLATPDLDNAQHWTLRGQRTLTLAFQVSPPRARVCVFTLPRQNDPFAGTRCEHTVFESSF